MFPTMFQNLAAVFVICFITVFLYYKWAFKYWERKNVPYPYPTIPWGNLENPFMLNIGMIRTVENIYRDFKKRGCKYGGIFSTTRPLYIPIDLDCVKDVMTRQSNHFSDRGAYYHDKVEPIVGNLFFVDGEKWKNARVKLTPTFTSGKMKAMFQTVLDCGGQMKEAIDVMCGKSNVVDIKTVASCYTLDVIGSCAFGLDFDSFKNPDSEYRTLLKKHFAGGFSKLVRNFLAMSFPEVCKLFGMRFFRADVTTFFSTMVKDVINHRKSSGVFRNDFLQLLLGLNNGKDNNKSFTVDEMTAHAFSFFLAGFETTSGMMAFCLYELACNPDVQTKLRAEINEVLSKNEGRVSYECLNEMHYMTQVIEETLRLYPTIAVLTRVCTKDYTLPGTNTILETGTKVLLPVFSIQRDPDYFPNPDRFDPDRFSAKAKASRHQFTSLPFGEGPRICIGMRFAMMQAKIGLTILLRQYKYKLNHKTPKPLTLNPKSVLLSPVENILLDVEKID